jgi:hypothetical protein
MVGTTVNMMYCQAMYRVFASIGRALQMRENKSITRRNPMKWGITLHIAFEQMPLLFTDAVAFQQELDST